MIAIENPIRIDRTLIENFQPDRDFLFSIAPWLKNFQQTLIENRDIYHGLPSYMPVADLVNFS